MPAHVFGVTPLVFHEFCQDGCGCSAGRLASHVARTPMRLQRGACLAFSPSQLDSQPARTPVRLPACLPASQPACYDDILTYSVLWALHAGTAFHKPDFRPNDGAYSARESGSLRAVYAFTCVAFQCYFPGRTAVAEPPKQCPAKQNRYGHQTNKQTNKQTNECQRNNKTQTTSF